MCCGTLSYMQPLQLCAQHQCPLPHLCSAIIHYSSPTVQLNQCHRDIERMQREMAQKNAIISDLATQVSQDTSVQDLHDELVEEVHEENPTRAHAHCTLADVTAQRDALQARADGHKKVVTMLQAQIASHKLKADKSAQARRQAAAALDVERAHTQVCQGRGCCHTLHLGANLHAVLLCAIHANISNLLSAALLLDRSPSPWCCMVKNGMHVTGECTSSVLV